MTAATSLQRLARRALLTRAKADAALTALVSSASIAPDGEPAWPFMLIEAPTMLPLRASCVRGAAVTFDVHAFAGPRMDAGATVETAFDHTSRIGAQIETVFADNRIELEDGSIAHLTFSDRRMLRDATPEAWHWFGQLNCRVLAAA